MSLIGKLSPKETQTVEDYIDNKVDYMIEKAVVEGKKRRQIENKVADVCSDPSTDMGNDYLNSFSDFSEFPKYAGRGIQNTAPDFDGNTLTMWFTDVSEDDVKYFIEQVISVGFEHADRDDYIREIDGEKQTMAISYSSGKLRIFYKHN